MEVFFSKHSREQMLRRRINEENVYQSLIRENDVMFLVRIFIDMDKQPNVIVTVYKTTKISKYYES